MKRMFLLMTLLVMATSSAWAQLYSLSGRITESGSGRALQGASVRIIGEGAATTDSDGRYSIGGLSAGTYRIEVAATGHGSVMSSVFVQGNTVRDYSLPVLGGPTSQVASITGTVFSNNVSIGVRPLAGATLRLMPGNYTTTSSSNGTYSFSGIPIGTYALEVSAPGHTSATAQFVLSGSRVQNITLNPTGTNPTPSEGTSTLRGTVLMTTGNGSVAASGVTLRLTPGNYTITSGSDGSFSFAGIPAGRYMLHVKGAGGKAVNQRVTLPMANSLTITLRGASTGRVSDSDDDDDRNGKAKGKSKNKGKGKK